MAISELHQNDKYCNVLSLHGPKRKKVRGKKYIQKRRALLDKKGDRYTTTRDERGFRDIFSTGEWGYRRGVGAAWRVEIEGLKSVRQRRVHEKRLNEYLQCGHVIKVRRCRSCGNDREGSGTFEGTRTCKCRTCASCAWIRSKEVGDFVEAAFDKLEGCAEWRWQMAVVTIRYSPEDEDDLGVEALRSRALLAGKVAGVVWKKLLKRPGAAMLRTIECSKRGHVHLNLIYFGPEIDKDNLDAVVKAVDYRVGFCKVQNLDTAPASKKKRVKSDDPRGSKEAVKTAAKYASKGIETCKGGNDEDWLAGDRSAKVVDPILAARWEIASYRLKLLQKYGAFRGIKLEEHGKKKCNHDDGEIVCRHCGSKGSWKTVLRNAERWIQDCHDRGFPALHGSIWRPKRDGPVDIENYA